MSDYRETGGPETNPADATTGGNQGLTPAGAGQGSGAATAPKLSAVAKEYGDRIADAATTAKDFVAEKASLVTEKVKDLSNKDFGEVASEAKEYARKNPGQAILISAAAGLVLGLLIRGSRK